MQAKTAQTSQRRKRTARPDPHPDLFGAAGTAQAPPAAAPAAEYVAGPAAPPEPAQAAESARTWLDDFGDCDSAWAFDMPAPLSLQLRLRLGGDLAWVTASREHYIALRRTASAVFTRNEWAALACAAVAGRAGVGMADYVRRKVAAPHWELTHETTLGGVSGDAPTGRIWTVRNVCTAWLCDMVAVEVAN